MLSIHPTRERRPGLWLTHVAFSSSSCNGFPNTSLRKGANDSRDARIFESAFYHLLPKAQRLAPGNKLKLKGPLLALDATTIELCLSLSPWARTMRWAPGTVLIMDRAYVDFEWMWELTKEGVWFVTRMKKNCRYKVRAWRKTNRTQVRLLDQPV